MNHEIEINNNTFIIPNISGYSRVANHGLNGKPGFFVFHSGRATLIEFDDDKSANLKRQELITSIGNFWNSNDKFNSVNKETGFNEQNKGFFNKNANRR
jgi:hypothetical protein